MSDSPQEQSQKVAESSRMTIARCVSLSANEDFTWFINECIQRKLREETQIAIDIKKTPEERNDSVQRIFILSTIDAWLTDTETHNRIILERAEKNS